MSDDRDLSALYQSADKPQPPAMLDKSIRAAARKALRPKRSSAPQWLGGIAASLIAALLITQMMPTVEQEAEILTVPDNIAHPAADLAAPGPELREAAPAVTAPDSAPQKSIPERARTGNQQTQVRKKSSARDEADAVLSSEPLEKEVPGALSTPLSTSTQPGTELQAIADLLDAGKMHEARQRLDDFRKRYPGVDIPETITRRLPE